jgi:hypothetical protein
MSNNDKNKMNMYIEEKANVLSWVQMEKQKKECEKRVKVSINNGIPTEFTKEIINGTIVLDTHESCYCGKIVKRGALCHEPCHCEKIVKRGVLCHEPCYCGKIVKRGALCHEPCYCGKIVKRGGRLCHEPCHCGKIVTRGVLCH